MSGCYVGVVSVGIVAAVMIKVEVNETDTVIEPIVVIPKGPSLLLLFVHKQLFVIAQTKYSSIINI